MDEKYPEKSVVGSEKADYSGASPHSTVVNEDAALSTTSFTISSINGSRISLNEKQKQEQDDGFGEDPEKGLSTTRSQESSLGQRSPSDSAETLEALTPAHTHATSRSDTFYPEGGLQAWLVVFGSWCAMLAALGLMNTMASFQAHISRNQLSRYTDGEIGWIFSVYAFLSFGLGIFVGPVFDKHGPKLLMCTGSIMVVLAMMLLGLCKEYYQFILAFGVLGGTGTAFIFSPSIASVGHWFQRRRGFATGVAATGGAIGGVIFPLMMQYLLPVVGFGWTTRILGFVFLFLTGIGCLLVRSRLPPLENANTRPDVRILKDKAFGITVVAIFLIEWALFIPLTYISSYTLYMGFEEKLSYQVLMILNIGSVFGRWMPGFYADKIGAFNTMILTTIITVISVLAIWLPAGHTKAGLIIFALLFGFASGSNIGLTSVCVGKLCRTENLGRYFSTCYMTVSIGCLTGIPIVGEIIRSNGGAYWGLILFTGCCYVGGLTAFIVVRILKVGWAWKTVY